MRKMKKDVLKKIRRNGEGGGGREMKIKTGTRVWVPDLKIDKKDVVVDVNVDVGGGSGGKMGALHTHISHPSAVSAVSAQSAGRRVG